MYDAVDRGALAEKVRGWVEEIRPAGVCRQICVWLDGRRDPFDDVQVHGGDETSVPSTDTIVEKLAKIIEDNAKTYRGEMKRYEVRPFFGTNERPGPGMFGCTIGIADDEADGSMRPLEAPRGEGVLALGMRWTDAALAKALKSLTDANKDSRDTTRDARALLSDVMADNKALRNELREERAEKAEMQEAYESVLSLAHERKLAEERAVREAKNRAEMLASIKAFIPIIVNRIAGYKMLPELANPKIDMLRQVVDELDEKDAMALFSALQHKPRAAQLIGELMNSVIDERDRSVAIAKLVEEQKAEADAKTAAPKMNGAPAQKQLERQLGTNV